MLQGVQRAFESLVEIRVEGMVASERAVEYTRRLVEVGNVPILLQAIQRMADGHLVVGLQTRAPEPASQFHPLVIHFLKPTHRRRISR